MWWKIWGAILLVATIAIVILLRIEVKFSLPKQSRPESCTPVVLAVEPDDDDLSLHIDGAPTTVGHLITDLNEKRSCAAALTPIYIRANPTVKYGSFTALTAQLKAAGYVDVTMYALKREPQRF